MTIYFSSLEDYARTAALVQPEVRLCLSSAGYELNELKPATEDRAALAKLTTEAARLLLRWCAASLMVLPPAEWAFASTYAVGSGSLEPSEIKRLAKMIRNRTEGVISRKAWRYVIEARTALLDREIRLEAAAASEAAQ